MLTRPAKTLSLLLPILLLLAGALSASASQAYSLETVPTLAPASEIGPIRSAHGQVALLLTCSPQAVPACAVNLTLARPPKTHAMAFCGLSAPSAQSSLILASRAVRIMPGHRMRIRLVLDTAGRRMLKHLATLSVRLSATLVSPSSPAPGGGAILSRMIVLGR